MQIFGLQLFCKIDNMSSLFSHILNSGSFALFFYAAALFPVRIYDLQLHIQCFLSHKISLVNLFFPTLLVNCFFLGTVLYY